MDLTGRTVRHKVNGTYHKITSYLYSGLVGLDGDLDLNINIHIMHQADSKGFIYGYDLINESALIFY